MPALSSASKSPSLKLRSMVLEYPVYIPRLHVRSTEFVGPYPSTRVQMRLTICTFGVALKEENVDNVADKRKERKIIYRASANYVCVCVCAHDVLPFSTVNREQLPRRGFTTLISGCYYTHITDPTQSSYKINKTPKLHSRH